MNAAELERLTPPGWAWLRRLPFTRDEAMLALLAANEFFMGLDAWLAHGANGTLTLRELIPIFFGFLAAAVLLAAGWLARRNRPLASAAASAVFLLSIIVGLSGAWFHLSRGGLTRAFLWKAAAVDLLVWAPPVMAPLAFALVGILGISAAWPEDPPDSGELVLPGGGRFPLPYSKTRAYFYLAGMGVLAALISSALDHARTGFAHPAMWISAAAGVFAATAAVVMGAAKRLERGDLYTYVGAMALLIVIGVVGAVYHVRADLAGKSVIVLERFLRGAPVLAPLLYTNMGVLGLVALLPSRLDAPGSPLKNG
ncbi:MAG: hypothetical protein J7M29_06095 [Verrucomicrobia bacterium]|nr:hypothetical protein [Verrucomicrobiota bacterium]